MIKGRKNSLRLPQYDYSSDGAYFITVCVKDRKQLLSQIVGGDDHIAPKVELTQIGLKVQKYLDQIRGIDKYVIMPNHIHLIIIQNKLGSMWSSTPTNIPNIIRSFKTLVTKELGFSIWQTGYYDHIIRNEEDYLIKAQYIGNNPAKWQYDKYYSEPKEVKQ